MHCCCSEAEQAPHAGADCSSPPPLHAITRRRFTPLLGGAISLTTLALLPKCPACLAAYTLLFTGLTLSLSTASFLRWLLLASCLAALVGPLACGTLPFASRSRKSQAAR